ncbi:MAG: S8 family serine peptidase [Bacteroidia bacterium]
MLFCVYTSFELKAQTKKTRYVPGEYIIQLKPGADISYVTAEFPVSRNKSSNYKSLFKELNIWHLYIDTAENTSDYYLQQLRQNPDILYAQYNHYISLRGKTPSDSLFPQQWNLYNDGSLPNSIPGADINVSEAWKRTTGGSTANGDTIVIAVIDNGFDLQHEDLDYWVNRHEIPFNNIDDDNNGYTDDYRGWNVFTQTDSIPKRYHGTQVAGILGARGDNLHGICGINWKVKILPVAGSSETEAEVVAAYSYVYTLRKQYNANKKGAFIVCTNSSFGADHGRAEDFPIWCDMYNALGELGVLNVVSTANMNIDVDTEGDMPTSCESPYMISVTTSTTKDTKDTAAAFGKKTVDIAAPGINIFTTQPSGYGTESGTSMAAAHVSGSIGLLFSHSCPKLINIYTAHPSQTALYIKNVLLNSVDALQDFDEKTVSNGRLNTGKAMLALDKLCEENEALALQKIYPNPANGEATLQIYKTNPQAVKIMLVNMLGQVVFQQQTAVGKVGITEEKLNFTHLKQGAYILYLQSTTDISQPAKIFISGK